MQDQRLLRRLVDIVWQTATKSNDVPALEWADRLIDRAVRAEETEREEDRWRQWEKSL